jgi:hypothetical protein
MLTLLNESIPALRRFLGEALPRVSTDWWNTCVVRNLTEQQARVVRQKGVNSVDGLDLAALLRVFDLSKSVKAIDWRIEGRREWLLPRRSRFREQDLLTTSSQKAEPVVGFSSRSAS